MKTFTLDKNYKINCEFVDLKNGFKHTAILVYRGAEVAKESISYDNRTWERWEFETVIKNLILEYFKNKYQRLHFLLIVKNTVNF